jgi:small subunit ribosomal protein S11
MICLQPHISYLVSHINAKMGKMRIRKDVTGRKEATVGPILTAKQKKRITESKARVYIKSTFNNTIVTFTDDKGGVLLSASAGSSGFRGTKKSTPYAASVVSSGIARVAKKAGIKNVDIFIKGIGMGRESAARAIASAGIDVGMIKDVTPAPHNGCRPKKIRRP